MNTPSLGRFDHYQTCVGPNDDQGEDNLWGGSWNRQHCSETKTENTPVPGGMGFHTLCRMGPGLAFDSEGLAVGDFDSAYTIRMQVRGETMFEGPPAPPVAMTVSARRLGACPAGMKPGGSRRIGAPPPPG